MVSIARPPALPAQVASVFHLPLPRPVVDALADIDTVDRAMSTAAYAIETPRDAEAAARTYAGASFLAALIGPDGRAPSRVKPDGSSARADGDAARVYAGLWVLYALALAAPGMYSAAEGRGVMLALSCAAAPYRSPADVARLGGFTLGDGTRLGDAAPGPADLLRESALAGLALHALGTARADVVLIASGLAVLRACLVRFRSPDGRRYAHAVTPALVAGFGREAEGEAILGLLCLRLRADAYADELLLSVERYAAAHLTPGGQAHGYAEGELSGVKRVNVRASVLVAAFQREAGRTGEARETLAGLGPLRDDFGLLEGDADRTVSADAAIDGRYLYPGGAVAPVTP